MKKLDLKKMTKGDDNIGPLGNLEIKVPANGIDAGYFQIVNSGNGIEEDGDNYSVIKFGQKNSKNFQDVAEDINYSINQLKIFLREKNESSYYKEAEFFGQFLSMSRKPLAFWISAKNGAAIKAVVGDPKKFLNDFVKKLNEQEQIIIELLRNKRNFSQHEGIIRPNIAKRIINGNHYECLEIDGIELKVFYERIIKILEKFFNEIKFLD